MLGLKRFSLLVTIPLVLALSLNIAYAKPGKDKKDKKEKTHVHKDKHASIKKELDQTLRETVPESLSSSASDKNTAEDNESEQEIIITLREILARLADSFGAKKTDLGINKETVKKGSKNKPSVVLEPPQEYPSF